MKDYVTFYIDRMVEKTRNLDCIAIMSYAYNAIEVAHDIEQFDRYLVEVASTAFKLGYRDDIGYFCNHFCHLCSVDPMLIQAWYGRPLDWAHKRYDF